MRAILPAEVVLIVMTAAGMAGLKSGSLRAPIIAAALAGLALSVPDTIQTVRDNIVAPQEPPDATVFGRAPSLWAAVREHAAPTARVANNPRFLEDLTPWPVNISWALLADRSSCFAGREIAIALAPLFRLPSAMDNRPLKFEEFETRVNQTIYVSATPGPYELTKSSGVVVEQIIRPTGLIDPEVEIRAIRGQIDDLLAEIRIRAERNERVLVTVLTKRMAEDLAGYYSEVGVKCRYMHSEIETLERVRLLRDLRKGEYDVLIGINLLREGLDLPEVSLVAILDADKEGFLRSSGSLIQTIGRAARHLNGRAILYADTITDSMRRALDETDRRRTVQRAYNEENGITPTSIIRSLDMSLVHILQAEYADLTDPDEGTPEFDSQLALDTYIDKLESDMREAAKKFEFEKAAKLRDTIKELRTKEFLFS